MKLADTIHTGIKIKEGKTTIKTFYMSNKQAEEKLVTVEHNAK